MLHIGKIAGTTITVNMTFIVERGHWSNLQHQRELFNNVLGDKLNIRKLEDWYRVTAADVHNIHLFIRYRLHCRCRIFFHIESIL